MLRVKWFVHHQVDIRDRTIQNCQAIALEEYPLELQVQR
jgi:hypothetical protein